MRETYLITFIRENVVSRDLFIHLLKVNYIPSTITASEAINTRNSHLRSTLHPQNHEPPTDSFPAVAAPVNPLTFISFRQRTLGRR